MGHYSEQDIERPGRWYPSIYLHPLLLAVEFAILAFVVDVEPDPTIVSRVIA